MFSAKCTVFIYNYESAYSQYHGCISNDIANINLTRGSLVDWTSSHLFLMIAAIIETCVLISTSTTAFFQFSAMEMLEFSSDVASFVFFDLDRFLLDNTFALLVRSKMIPPP